jgi:hypothetical protein
MLWDIKSENRWTTLVTNGVEGVGRITLMIEKKARPKPGSEEKEDKFVLSLHGTEKGEFATMEEADAAGEKLRNEIRIKLQDQLNQGL